MVDDQSSKLQGEWLVDSHSKCDIWLNHGGTNKEVHWSGPCENGVAHGEGKLVIKYEHADERLTDYFEGELCRGKIHGSGHYHWANGDQYQGEYREGRTNGWGKYTWSDGRTFEGNWKDDVPHGKGAMKQLGGESHEKIWKHGISTRTESLDEPAILALRQFGRSIISDVIQSFEDETGQLSAQSMARIHDQLLQRILEMGRDPLKINEFKGGALQLDSASLLRAYCAWIGAGLLEELEGRASLSAKE